MVGSRVFARKTGVWKPDEVALVIPIPALPRTLLEVLRLDYVHSSADFRVPA